VDRLTQSVLVTLVGGALVALTVSGRFALYVKSGFGPLLLAAGIALAVVGIACAVLAVRADAHHRADARHQAEKPTTTATLDTTRVLATADVHATEPADKTDATADQSPTPGHAGHDHDRSRAAWLLVLPVLALLLAPPALGADAVARTAGSQAMAGAPLPDPNGPDQIVTGDGGYKPNDGLGPAPTQTTVNGRQVTTIDFPALPAGKNPDVTLSEFIQRALYDANGSVSRRTVTVTGFIAPAGKDFTGGYSIAQLIISCCAADARAIQVHVDGHAPYPANTWVTAVVTAYPGSGTSDNDYVPTVSVASITQRAQPGDPYGR